jgi:transposase-like protein
MSAPVTPKRACKRQEADTVKKSRFFEAFNTRTRESLSSIATQHGISKRTASYWLHQHQIQGSSAY